MVDEGPRRDTRWLGLPVPIVVALIGLLGVLLTGLLARGATSPDVTSPPQSTVTTGPSDTTTSSSGSKTTVHNDPTTTTSIPNPEPGSLELVDVVEVGSALEPAIEVKVKNLGGEVAFIKRVDFTITKYDFLALSGRVSSSATYEVEFPGQVESTPWPVPARVSQAVDPFDVDIFTLRLGVPMSSGSGIHKYTFILDVIYNGDDRTTGLSEPISVQIATRNPTSSTRPTVPGESMPTIPEVNVEG